MNPVLLTTALAPLIWGSTYLLTTTFLADLPATLLSLLRILPSGLLLLGLFPRRLPPKSWWGRIAVLGLLRQGLFFIFLYAAALHLPGGVAATIGGATAMLVILFAWPLLGQLPTPWHLALAGAGLLGVALISLTAKAALNPLGLLYAAAFTTVNALGVVLYKRWGLPPGATPADQAAWELLVGGLFLLPFSVPHLDHLKEVSAAGWGALAFMSLIGSALTAILWQRGLTLLPVQQVSLLGPLSPLTALLLDFFVAHRSLSLTQTLGAALVLVSVLLAALPEKRGHSG